MINTIRTALPRTLFLAAAILSLCGCTAFRQQNTQRFFWPPPPEEAKIEYLNYYFSDGDLLRGVDRRLEEAILGKRNPVRLITQPYSVASDGKGRIFVGDFVSKKIMVFDRQNHVSRELYKLTGSPQKVLVDARGEIWVLDATAAIVFHFSADEKLLTETKLNGVNRVASLAVDSTRERLYLSDTPNHRICVYDYAGTLVTTFGERGREPGQFNYPTDLDLDAVGNLYVVDAMNARIQILSPEGVFLRTFGERGTERGSFFAPKGVAVSPSHLVYVTDANQNKVVIFNDQGEYLLTIGGRYVYDGENVQPGGFFFPVGIDADANDTIFIADFFNGMIHEFQYLTPAYLAQHPIRPEDVYIPRDLDFKSKEQGAEAAVPSPASGAESVEAAPPAVLQQQTDKR